MKQDYKSFDFNHGDFKGSASWLLPQTLAMIARCTSLVRNENGLINAQATMEANMDLDGLGPEVTGAIYRYLITEPRGNIIGTASEYMEYCALVPLYMSAFKKYKDIPYSEWDKTNLEYTIDKGLLEAMLAFVPAEITDDMLIEYRTHNTYNNLPAHKTTAIKATKEPMFDSLPRLAKIMLCQVWVAHPSRRNKYMILAPYDWDDMPEPLTTQNVGGPLPPWMTQEIGVKAPDPVKPSWMK